MSDQCDERRWTTRGACGGCGARTDSGLDELHGDGASVAGWLLSGIQKVWKLDRQTVCSLLGWAGRSDEARTHRAPGNTCI